MKHSRQERRHMIAMALEFIKGNPPRMPEAFTRKDWRRMTGYAISAFLTGYTTAENDYARARPLRVPKRKAPRA